jgi:hypothetical protein
MSWYCARNIRGVSSFGVLACGVRRTARRSKATGHLPKSTSRVALGLFVCFCLFFCGTWAFFFLLHSLFFSWAARAADAWSMSAKAVSADHDALRQTLLDALAVDKTIADLRAFCLARPDGGLEYVLAEGCCRGLAATGYVVLQDVSTKTCVLTDEAQGYVTAGTPEFQFVQHVPAEGRPFAELQNELGQVASLGLAKGIAARWVRQDKTTGMIHRTVPDGVIEDTVALQLRAVANGGAGAVSDKDAGNLKKRKLLKDVKITSLVVTQGPNFSPTFRKLAGDLTKELLEGCVCTPGHAF